MIVLQRGEGIDIPMSCTIERGVVHQHSVGIPVAVDIFGTRGAGACRIVVSYHIADAIGGIVVRQIDHDALLMILYVIVVEGIEAVGERGFQFWVTFGDVHRVAIVCDIEQLRYAGLAGVAAIGDAELAHLGKFISEENARRYVGHVAHGIGVYSLIILGIV